MAADPPTGPPALRADSDDDGPPHHVFRLFVIGTTPRSSRAIVNARRFCETRLGGRYELDVVDISLHPELAAAEQILAAPTLIRALPLPRRQFIGDMSETDRLCDGLGLARSA